MTPDDAIFNKLYKTLNPGQKSAVDTIEGPVIVNAGPGTGKTQILTLRIANILRHQGADMAENILALTFTNAGVTAMRKRLATIVGSEAYRVNIFTFHSFAEHIIKQYPEQFESLLQATAITDADRYNTTSSIITTNDLELLRPFAAPLYYVPSVLSAIDSLKRDNISPDDFLVWNEQLKKDILADENSYYKRNGKGFSKGDQKPDVLKSYEKNKELASVYEQYNKQLRDGKTYDFTDMIMFVIDAIEQDDNFKYLIQEKYQYVLVDEHQDTNAAQNKIIELLTDAEHLGGRPNLFTVGDDKQAIYRFQGASLENFLAFENKYSDVAHVSLQENYRSGQQVLDSSHSLIKQDSLEREHVKLHAQNEKSTVSIHEFNSYEDELHWVAQQILVLQENGTKIRDIAVVYRENRHTTDIQKIFAQYSIPTVVMAKQDILNSSLVFKILLLLRVVNNLSDNGSLVKLLYSDVFNTNVYDVVKIVERFRRNKKDKKTGTKHLFKIIQDKAILKDIGVENIDDFIGIAEILQLGVTTFASDNFLPAFDELMRMANMIESIISSDDSGIQLHIYDRLYQELRGISEINPRMTIADVLQHVEILEKFNLTLEASPQDHLDGVRLLTAHKSKGLEYEHVFITNVVDKVWGNKTLRKQFQLPDGAASGDNDDERRLLYVGITRAMTQCYLSFAKNTGSKDTVPSQFLYDLDSDVVTWNKHAESIDITEKYKPVDTNSLHHTLFDHDLIVSLYEKRALSVTALNNYIDCPGKYFVNNLLQVPATYSRSLIYGSLMHRALELYFRQSSQAGAILDKQKLIDLFLWAVDEEYLEESEKIDIIKKGVSSLEGYYKTHATTWSHEVENEMRINGVQLAIGSKTITLTGVLDKVEKQENGNKIRVIDYKTGKTFSEKIKDQKAALERQLVFYSLLLRQYRDGYYTMTSGVLDFVEPNKKTGEYEIHETSPDSSAREELIQHIQIMDNEINSGIDFLNKRCGKNECDACQLLKHL